MNESLRRSIITYSGVLLLMAILIVGLRFWLPPPSLVSDQRETGTTEIEKTPQEEREKETAPSTEEESQPTAMADNFGVATGQPPQRKARDRFIGAKVLAEKSGPVKNGEVSRVRLLQVKEFGSTIRVEEKLKIDADGGQTLTSQQAMVADRLLVQPVDEAAAETLAVLAEKENFTLIENGPHSTLLRLTIPGADIDSIPAMLKILAPLVDQGLLIAEPDYLMFTFKTPTDPFLARQSGLERMEAPEAWNISTGSADVVIAVIDTGMDLDHPDLAGNLWTNTREIASNGIDDDGNGKIDDVNGWDFFGINGDNEDKTPEDQDDHGTHVSGILGASGNNGLGVTGVNWNVKIIPLRVGNTLFPVSSIEPALNYVQFLKQHRGVNIVATNNSYGSESFSSIMQSAIARHRAEDILFVAAAGNDGFSNDISPQYPAGYNLDNIISVAATTGGENLASFSNFGRNSVDLGAPGSQIYSSVRFGGYDFLSGTSMAAPQVTGAAGLIGTSNPGLGYLEIKELILGTVDPFATLQGTTITGGRLNLRKALEASINVSPVRLVALNTPVVHLENAETGLLLEARLEEAGQGVEQATGTLSWEAFPNDAGVILQTSGFRGVAAYFPDDGEYRIRATYREGLGEEGREAFIRVGNADLLISGLKGHWEFEEGSGNLASDSSGNGRNGSLSGPTWSAGIIGGALNFDGSNDGLSFSYPTLANYTVTAWVKADSGGNSVFPRIMNTPEFILYWGRRDDGFEPDQKTVKFVAERSVGVGGVWNTTDNVIGDGQWFHIAATLNASADFPEPRIYVDGVSLAVATQEPPQGSRTVASGTAYIGDNGDPALSRNWDGLIDDMRLYDRILAPSEVAALAAGSSFATIPTVNAGIDLTAIASSAITIEGQADPGVSFHWEWVSGPASPQIIDPFSLQTDVVFPVAGDYRLRLVADGGSAIGFDEIQVSVTAGGGDPGLDVFGGAPLVDFPGWRASDWYLNYNVDLWPWIFHDEHGWQFVAEASSSNAIFVWDAGLEEWLFLNENTYRWMFLFGETPDWIWTFSDNTPEQRFFQKSESGGLFSLPPGI